MNKIKMNQTIFVPSDELLKNEDSCPEESFNSNMEFKFVNKLCDLILTLFDVQYKDERIVKPLLEKHLYNLVNHDGIANQYVDYHIEKTAKNLKRSLDIPENIKINWESSNKFSNIITYLQENYVKISDIKSDGTFQTIIEKQAKSCGNDCGCESPVIGVYVAPTKINDDDFYAKEPCAASK